MEVRQGYYTEMNILNIVTLKWQCANGFIYTNDFDTSVRQDSIVTCDAPFITFNSIQMTREEFFQLAKNRNLYKVIKQLPGTLNYAKIGDKFHSDTLYDLGYNIFNLIEDGFLELLPRIFPFERELVGKNLHSVFNVCPECGNHGINMPLEKQCGNCGYTETRTYYDAETIHEMLNRITGSTSE